MHSRTFVIRTEYRKPHFSSVRLFCATFRSLRWLGKLQRRKSFDRAHLCQRQRIELTWKRAMTNRYNDDRGPYPRINRNRVVTLAVTRTWEIGSFSNKWVRYTIATLRSASNISYLLSNPERLDVSQNDWQRLQQLGRTSKNGTSK